MTELNSVIERQKAMYAVSSTLEKAISDRKKPTPEKTPEKSENTVNTRNFPDLVSRFNDLATDPTKDPTAYSKTLTDLATAIVFCVLKKCIDPTHNNKTNTVSNAGYNSTMVSLKNSVNADRVTFESYSHAVKNITYHTEYNKKGDPIKICDTPDFEKVISELTHGKNFGDGYDLVNECIITILSEIEKQKKRDPEKPIDFERPYTVNRLKKKVYIKKVDSIGGYETVKTMPIIECFKAVRRSIEGSRAIQTDPKNGYVYIDDLITSPDGDPDTIYYRLPKYADLGGYVKNFNDAETVYTADISAFETLESIDNLMEKLNLTKKQAEILNLRLKGYGSKAIATYFGIKAESVKDSLKLIRKKAEKIGLTPEKYDYTPDTEKTPTPEKTPKKATPAKYILIALLENYYIKHTFFIQDIKIPVIPVNNKELPPVKIFTEKTIEKNGRISFKYILHK